MVLMVFQHEHGKGASLMDVKTTNELWGLAPKSAKRACAPHYIMPWEYATLSTGKNVILGNF